MKTRTRAASEIGSEHDDTIAESKREPIRERIPIDKELADLVALILQPERRRREKGRPTSTPEPSEQAGVPGVRLRRCATSECRSDEVLIRRK